MERPIKRRETLSVVWCPETKRKNETEIPLDEINKFKVNVTIDGGWSVATVQWTSERRRCRSQKFPNLNSKSISIVLKRAIKWRANLSNEYLQQRYRCTNRRSSNDNIDVPSPHTTTSNHFGIACTNTFYFAPFSQQYIRIWKIKTRKMNKITFGQSKHLQFVHKIRADISSKWINNGIHGSRRKPSPSCACDRISRPIT